MSELEHAFQLNETLGESSKRIYRSVYKRLIELTDYTKIRDVSELVIIKAVDKDSIPPKSQESLIDVAILIRKFNNVGYEKLFKFKHSKIKKRIDIYKLEKNINLKEILPSKQTLERYTKTLYNDSKYVEYIVNYLLVNFGVRNKDLNLIITSDKDVMAKNAINKNNYLYVTVKYVVFIRNDYKTYDTYGQKKTRIVKRPFLSACLNLLGDNYDVPLLTLKNGDEISEESVGRVIQSMTYNELGEGNYMKINVLDAKESNNIKRIRELSANRGTAIETIFAEYDIDNNKN